MEKKLNKALDSIDIKILNELQRNGKISNIDLSKKVGLSPTPCLERVKRLEKQGVIMGYRALLNPELLDQALDEILECHLVSGDFDYLLKTRVADMAAYRKLLGTTLLRLPGVNDTRTYVVMEEVKQTNYLVLK